MSDDFTFMMGEYAARIPEDRLYATNHHWLQADGAHYKVGLTAYSVRLLQDVYFLDWSIDPNTNVQPKQQIGEIESSKALSGLFACSLGTVLAFNPQLLDDPSAINADCYGQGWLYTFQTEADCMSPAAYLQFLDDNWENTQRMIKGQMN